jgi:hypothetical protein
MTINEAEGAGRATAPTPLRRAPSHMKLKHDRRIARASHDQVGRQIAAVEKAVLRLQPLMMQAAGGQAAEDSNIAIILAARLALVWKRLGKTLSM